MKSKAMLRLTVSMVLPASCSQRLPLFEMEVLTYEGNRVAGQSDCHE
jgi:hypothetical protein